MFLTTRYSFASYFSSIPTVLYRRIVLRTSELRGKTGQNPRPCFPETVFYLFALRICLFFHQNSSWEQRGLCLDEKNAGEYLELLKRAVAKFIRKWSSNLDIFSTPLSIFGLSEISTARRRVMTNRVPGSTYSSSSFDWLCFWGPGWTSDHSIFDLKMLSRDENQ